MAKICQKLTRGAYLKKPDFAGANFSIPLPQIIAVIIIIIIIIIIITIITITKTPVRHTVSAKMASIKIELSLDMTSYYAT